MSKLPSYITADHALFLAFTKAFRRNVFALEYKIYSNGFSALSSKGPFELTQIYTFINQLHLPFIHQREGTWSDNPKDNGGATMRGITLKTFRNKFDSLLDLRKWGIIDAEYDNLFNRVKATKFKTDPQLGRDLLKTLFTDKENIRPFVAYYYTSPNTNGLRLSTYDPFVSFLIIDKTWMSGGYAWSNFVENGSIYSAAKRMGYLGATPHYCTVDFLQWVQGLNVQDVKSNVFATNLIQAFVNHANGIAAKHKSQVGFLNGWLARFVGSSKDRRLNYISVGEKWIQILSS